MLRSRAIGFALITLALGCSSASNKDTTTDPSANAEASSAFEIEGPQQEDVVLEGLQTGVDSAAALYDMGDVSDFLTVRDSLRLSIEAIVAANPQLRDTPEFEQLMRNLEGLEGMFEGHTSTTIAVDDSLALAAEAWPEIDSTAAQELAHSAVTDTVFPMIANDRIDFWIRYFTGPGRERFERSLYRMELYRPIVEEIIDEQDLPRDLICVALIESGFVMKARSYASAVGPWQFISGTARIYGLRVNWWYDERRDIVASTWAATNYLKDLYGIWESWPLALASYNCGEYRVARAIARQGTENFWQLKLPKQTERYVPKFLATLYIIRDLEKYGFTVPEVEPVRFDEVTITDATDIKLLAKCAETSGDVIMEMNPSLLRWTTPPRMEVVIKVPVGRGETLVENLADVPPEERVTWQKHRVQKGETLSVIARGYGTSVSALKELNGIRNAHRIRAGQTLIVPAQSGQGTVASTGGPTSKPAYKDTRRNLAKADLDRYAQKYKPPSGYKEVVYRVKKGDTLGHIAEDFNTRASRIREWNGLSYRSYIYPGQKLKIYVPDTYAVSSDGSLTPDEKLYAKQSYTVKKGDTFYGISKQFNVSMSELMAWNNKSSRSTLYPGQKLDIWQKK